MPNPNLPSDRFRSATDFPQSIAHLPPTEANEIYTEMRDCLIFTNRSRAQLVRRNEEHKQKALILKSDVIRLQESIDRLNREKQSLAQNQQNTINELEQELRSMTRHLDQLSKAFEDVEDINSAMGVMAIPGRFARFWQALKALIVWWREEHAEDSLTNSRTLPASFNKPLSEQEIRENPQLGSDPASINRSLLDR
ncbi:hypothetical protein OsccyDRAFT_0428 [Leptolyngbyaceae cyanobacterium JSC-12]|nr:hypothetical protein OsccyDRAFT_0428 [Leptolyngbyaceae cyanobacterium JSC-12]